MAKRKDKLEIDSLLDEKDAVKEMLATNKNPDTLKKVRGWRIKVNERLKELGYVLRKKNG